MNFDIKGRCKRPNQMRSVCRRASLLRRGRPEHKCHLESTRAAAQKMCGSARCQKSRRNVVALGEILFRVIDDVIRPERANKIDIARAADAGHFRAKGFRNLHRESADAARRAIIDTFCPALTCPLSRRPCSAVMPATPTEPASSNVMFAGFSATRDRHARKCIAQARRCARRTLRRRV